jgi:RNA polymerase sigma factor (sigma-70 family)
MIRPRIPVTACPKPCGPISACCSAAPTTRSVPRPGPRRTASPSCWRVSRPPWRRPTASGTGRSARACWRWYQRGTNLEAWLFTILRNVFYSQHRKLGREIADADGNHAERLTSIPEQSGHLDLQDVRAALDRLAPVMREALILVAIENLSYEEAAAVMNCRIGTVKSRVWRAREQLARMLGYSGSEIGSDGVMLSVTGASA